MTDCHDNQFCPISMCYFVSSIWITKGDPTFGHQTHKGQVRIVVEGIKTKHGSSTVCSGSARYTQIFTRIVSSVLAWNRTRRILERANDTERGRMQQSWSSLSLSALGKVFGGGAGRSPSAWLLSGGFHSTAAGGHARKLIGEVLRKTKPSGFFVRQLTWKF